MSRHRIVRGMDYNDEYDGYDDVYGHSVDDDDMSISPTDARQWLYNRERGQQSMRHFIDNNKDIAEEGNVDDEEEEQDAAYEKSRRDSDNFQMPTLSDMEQAQLNSCIDEVRSVVGDAISERRIVETSIRFGYDISRILDDILSEDKASAAVAATSAPSSKSKTRPSKVPPSASSKTAGSSSTAAAQVIECQMGPPILKVTPSTGSAKVVGKRAARRGFDTPSPQPTSCSPAVSGRNTPTEPGSGGGGGDDEDSSADTKGSLVGATTTTSSSSSAATAANLFKVPKEQAQRNATELYAKERAGEKISFHMIVIGHVDAGKSTMMGHLLYDTGYVSQRVMHKHELESRKLGKQSFMYAWVLDETGEERTRGITMDIGQSRIETASKVVTLLDAPGHRDFIPNMISGATQADVALLVVDATRGEFESGFELGGQTREHALLVRSLGVQQLGVVVNKLDTVGWSQQRFDEIVGKLRAFLFRQAGYRESDVTFIPCSGLTGENLCRPASEPGLQAWYSGPHLLQVIDNFKIPERAIDRPFRMSVSDVFKGTGSGFCIAGRIETGVLALNDKVLVGASREQAQVKTILLDDQLSQTNAFAGDPVTVTLTGVDVNTFTVGCIICDPQCPIPVTTRFQARILVFNVSVRPITIGYPVLLHHQSLIEPAVICKLQAQIHKGTGEVVKRKPRCLGTNSCALVELETTRPICIERYADGKELGRFMLRVSGVTIAAGMVIKIR